MIPKIEEEKKLSNEINEQLKAVGEENLELDSFGQKRVKGGPEEEFKGDRDNNKELRRYLITRHKLLRKQLKRDHEYLSKKILNSKKHLLEEAMKEKIENAEELVKIPSVLLMDDSEGKECISLANLRVNEEANANDRLKNFAMRKEYLVKGEESSNMLDSYKKKKHNLKELGRLRNLDFMKQDENKR